MEKIYFHHKMVDVKKIVKGNISLPLSLQSPDIEKNDNSQNEEKNFTIFNMQKTLYEVKIEDIEKRIKRFFYILYFS